MTALARVVKLVDAGDSKSPDFGRASSSLASGTKSLGWIPQACPAKSSTDLRQVNSAFAKALLK